MFLKLHYLHRAIRYRLQIDPAEIRFVCDSLRTGQFAVDVGCHKGAYTYWMRRRVGPGGAVYAFEPQPRQVAYLRSVFAAMSYDNVEVVPLALSDHIGSMPLFLPPGLGKTHGASLELSAVMRSPISIETTIRRPQPPAPSSQPCPSPALAVDVTTLDDFFATKAQRPSFLKIDVEGHELAVLHGARRTLEQSRPAVLLECEARHRPDRDVRPVFSFLEALGYEGTFFENRVRRPLSEFDPAVHQHLDEPDPVFLPRGYVNNFAFIPRAMASGS